MNAYVLIVVALATSPTLDQGGRSRGNSWWPAVTMQRFDDLAACKRAEVIILEMSKTGFKPATYCTPASDGPELQRPQPQIPQPKS